MNAIRSGLLGLLLVVLALSLAPAAPPLPANPHQPLNEKEACPGCHAYFRGTLAPHDFVVSIPEKCWECHSPKALGRSHPVGVEPSRSDVDIEIPDDLPLEDGKVSCGSCHNPHLAFLSKTRAYREQEVRFLQKEGRAGTPWYQSLFLRMSDPVKGFEPLCTACHKNF